MKWTHFWKADGSPELCLILDLKGSLRKNDYVKRVQILRPCGRICIRERTIREIHDEPFIFEP